MRLPEIFTLPRSIRFIIVVAFTAVSVSITGLLGVGLYRIFARHTEQLLTESSAQLLHRVSENLGDYLKNMRALSDAIYYASIKSKDFAVDNTNREMELLYEANRDDLISLALYRRDGTLLGAAPVAVQKQDVDVRRQAWFQSAAAKVENLHFSTPHVQDLFDDPSYRYHWVISLSRAVELNEGGQSSEGILLVDMNYKSVADMLDDVNQDSAGRYVYLCDSRGDIIYHPRRMQIDAGLVSENNLTEAGYADGAYREYFQGERREVVVETVSYTGWKLISVIPGTYFALGLLNARQLALAFVLLTAAALALVNRLMAAQVSKPLIRLNESIRKLELGQDSKIYVGGSAEVRHLGRTLQSYVREIQLLMRDIVREQEEKRKSELDALQSQINPHFLYNTLDSIVWMIEGQRYDDAVVMITELASLFRISLSGGKTIISMEAELRHAENYMNIQKVRFKNSFRVRYEIDPEVRNYCTVKLILQPILENAIYYGVKGMEEEGEILLRAELRDGELLLTVRDNGFGIPEEEVPLLLREGERRPSRGSGVGLLNVQRRIQLRFGEHYGLAIESEPDEGTEVRICLPAVPYNEENRQRLEEGR